MTLEEADEIFKTKIMPGHFARVDKIIAEETAAKRLSGLDGHCPRLAEEKERVKREIEKVLRQIKKQ